MHIRFGLSSCCSSSLCLVVRLWQATRFALLNFDEKFSKPTGLDHLAALMKSSPSLADAWILHRLHLAIVATDAAFKGYKLGDATTAIRNFWLYDLCDVYLVRAHTTTHLHTCSMRFFLPCFFLPISLFPPSVLLIARVPNLLRLTPAMSCMTSIETILVDVRYAHGRAGDHGGGCGCTSN
jgi:hypothetical protein